MSIYNKATLVQIPSGYKSGKLYSVLPNTADGDFTVSADEDATRVNKDGLIESTSANQARLNYNFIDGVVQPDPHLLLEATRTNSLTYSEAFDNSYYSKFNTSITPNVVTSPKGSLNADKIVENSNDSFHSLDSAYTSIAGDLSASMFVKKDERKYIRLIITQLNPTIEHSALFDLENKSIYYTSSGVTAEINEFQDDWFRIKISVNSTGNLARMSILLQTVLQNNSQSYQGDGTSGIYIWGAQLEAGSYPTSYIPTSGSAVTRTEDFCYINSGLADILNTNEGTLFVDVEVPRVSTTGSYERIALTDQNASTDRVLFDNYNGSWRVVLISSAGTQTASIRSVQANTRIKVAFTYSSSQIRVSYDGNDATTTSISYTPSTTLESFKFSNKDGGNKWQGKIYQAMYFDTALSNSELEEITSYKSFGQMAKALLYTIE